MVTEATRDAPQPSTPRPTGRSRFTTRVVSSPAEIAAIAEACARCRKHQRRPQADIGLDQAPPAVDGSRVVLLLDGEDIAGFARIALDVRKYPVRFRLFGRSFTLARFALTSAEYTDNDLVAPDDECAREDLLRALLDACADCRVLRLRFVAEDSDLWRLLTSSRARRARRWIAVSWVPTPRWLLRVPKTFGEYTLKFSRKTRHNLRRKVRQLDDACAGRLRTEVVAERSSVRRFLDDVRAIASASARPAATARLLQRSCPAERLERLADSGKARCYVLRAGDEPIAFLAGWVVDGVYHMAMSGYDMRWARYSPGTMLDYLVIQDIIASGAARWMDYGLGHLDYKQFFATHAYLELCAHLARPGLRAALAFGPLIARGVLRRLLDRMARRSGPDAAARAQIAGDLRDDRADLPA